MIQYKKKLLSSIKLKRKLPINYNSLDEKYFSRELNKFFPSVYYFKLTNTIISGDGTPINFPLGLLKKYLGFSALSGNIKIKKLILLLKFFIDFLKIKILNKKKIKIKNALIIHDRSSIGYFHWINDFLPKLLISKEIKKNYKIIIPSNLNFDFHKFFLKDFKNKIIILEKELIYEIENAIFVPDLSPSGNPRPENILKIKKKFKIGNYNLKKNVKNIYISRNLGKRRYVSNEKELIKYLKKKKFEIFYFEKLSLQDQINLISKCKTVLSMHGAALANIIWMKKNSNIIEFKPKNDIHTNCFFAYSNILQLNYHYLICKKKNLFKSTKNSNYYVDISRLNNILTSIDEKKN